MIQVVGVEAISYAARMGVNATFMKAFHIPVSLENVFLIVAASSISSTVAVAPGAVGRRPRWPRSCCAHVATQSEISAYAIGQQVITTAWNVAFGLTLLATTIGWKETRALVHVKKKKPEDGEEAPLEPAGADPPVIAGAESPGHLAAAGCGVRLSRSVGPRPPRCERGRSPREWRP